ncbi:MAG: hypothetical protein HC821_03445 [Lewinella sp.]|nr:hypothetical protein [Lewinella sp.]
MALTETQRGRSCTVSASFTVVDQRAAPAVDPGPGATLTCAQSSIRLGGPATATGPEILYVWTGPPAAVFLDAPSMPRPRVSTPGSYQLLVVNQLTGCQDSAQALVGRDTIRPRANIQGGGVLSCFTPSLRLSADTAQLNQADLSYRWSAACLPSPVFSPILNVNCPGSYQLIVRNVRTGCFASQTITIAQDTAQPRARVAAPALLNCFHQPRC